MSYTPTDWKTGDVITADKLNNMEQGIVNAPGVAVFEFEVISNNNNQVVTDATVDGVAAAFNAGKVCIARICKHGSEQPVEESAKEDYVFSCFGGTVVYALKNLISSASSFSVSQLNGNQSGWTYTVTDYRADANPS